MGKDLGICNNCKHLSWAGGVTFEKKDVCMDKFWKDKPCYLRDKKTECKQFKQK